MKQERKLIDEAMQKEIASFFIKNKDTKNAEIRGTGDV